MVDPLTAKINLSAVNASYPDLMTAVAIVKKDSGEANRDQPVGTGPFKFESWSPNESTVYVRNDSLLRSLAAAPRLGRLPSDSRSPGRGHQSHRGRGRSGLQPAHPAADGADL